MAKLTVGNQDQATTEKPVSKSMDFSHAFGLVLKWLLNRFSLPLAQS
jgi:hypothetical protein